MTTQSKQPPTNEEVRAYEALVDRTRQALRRFGEVTGEAMTRGIDQAKQQSLSAGGYTANQVDRATRWLRRDLASLRANSEQARGFVQRTLDPARAASPVLGLITDILSSSGGLLASLSDKVEGPIRYNTGEVTGPGTLTCRECGNRLHFTEPARVPPCGKCHRTKFRKSY